MTLKDRLIDRIRAHGPLTFADYMEAALYDPAEGFFSRAPVGREFVTSPHVSPVFGALLARQIAEMGAEVVVDLGAGDGLLGRQLRAAVPELRYIPVEISEAARAGLGSDARASLADLAPFEGVVVANELFDNVPFHLFRGDREVVLDVDGDRLVEREVEPTLRSVIARTGEYTVLGQAARDLIGVLAKTLVRGYAVVVDYGFSGDEQVERVRGYRAHRAVEDLLAAPGETDITGPVDFDAFRALAEQAGFATYGPVTQREALMALGYRDVLDEMRAEQRRLEQLGEWRKAIEIFNARGEASMLVDPAGLGSLKVMVLGTEGLPEPRLIPVP